MTKNEVQFKGLFTALVTPFKNGEVDEASFKRLLHHQLDQGVEGFVINGTTGESPTLTLAELKRLWQIAKSEVAGKIPLVLGSGTNSTASTCELSRELSSWGPQGLLVVVPYYNRPSQQGLLQHFTQVAKASRVPILLYNVPSRTVAGLTLETTLALSENPQIAGIKDATGDMHVLQAMRARVRPDFSLLSGDDSTCNEYQQRGGHGVISVSSHLVAREMRQADFAQKYSELLRLLYIEANPIPVKMALHWMGLLESPELRLPLTSLDEKFHKDFQACLKKLGKI